MSKYDPLWNYIKKSEKDRCSLSFEDIQEILGFEIDHSFLTYKKELFAYGYKVEKISMKNQMVGFQKL